MNRRVIVLALFALLFLQTNTAQAATACYCYFGDKNDCAPIASNDNTTTNDCEVDCRSQYKDAYKKNDFTADSVSFGANFYSQCTNAHTSANPPEIDTKAVMPKLNIPLPGVSFSPIQKIGGELHVDFLGQYINGIYKFLIIISSAIAVVMIMIGGLKWVLSAQTGKIKQAQEQIKNAVTGLVLLLSVVLILTVVNPQLIEFNPSRVKFIDEIPPEAYMDRGDITEPSSQTTATESQTTDSSKHISGDRVCKTPKECEQWCKNHSNTSTWPESTDKTIDPSLTQIIPNSPGVKNPRKSMATAEMIEAIKKAGQLAIEENPNYFIQVQSAYRNLRSQIKLVCNKVNSGKDSEIAKIGKTIAFPGGSFHGSGVAIDITLYDGKDLLVTSSFTDQFQDDYEDGANILADIMANAGFVRYKLEIWHFELEGKSMTGSRCKGSENCPFPPGPTQKFHVTK